MKEDYRTAEKYYAKALKALPGEKSLMRDLAIAYQKTGKAKQATALLERLIREGSPEDAASAEQYLELIGKERK